MTHAISYYDLETLSAERLKDSIAAVAKEGSLKFNSFTSKLPGLELHERTVPTSDLRLSLVELLASPDLRELLLYVSRLPVFSDEVANAYSHDLTLLGSLKKLKYFLNLPVASFLYELLSLTTGASLPSTDRETLSSLISAVEKQSTIAQVVIKELIRTALLPPASGGFLEAASPLREPLSAYESHAALLETADPHAVYPTSIYRQCHAVVHAATDASLIEAVMGTEITTTIKIVNGVLDLDNLELRKLYLPLGRAVAIVDRQVDQIHGKAMDTYFRFHQIELKKLVYGGMEKDKDISSVENILLDLKHSGVCRNEPVLVVGGGVIADIAGFATALYHRNTPYVMLATSVVSGIDAGPSPRTCCDGSGYKNIYGSYHPPVMTLTDRSFFSSLHTGWVRHGLAEIAKMAIVKDSSLFDLLEKHGGDLVHSKLGTEGPLTSSADFQKECDLIIGKAMESYVKSEYGNLWETHQCRPHAYGHTWSPGYEIPAGLLHGHAVATCMGFGAFLAVEEGLITEAEMERILALLSKLELAIWHPILDDKECVWSSQVKMVQKRGGNLAAPVPKGEIGKCGYINVVSRERLDASLDAYKLICSKYPREGRGIDEHCTDVGLEPAGTVGTNGKQHEHEQTAASGCCGGHGHGHSGRSNTIDTRESGDLDSSAGSGKEETATAVVSSGNSDSDPGTYKEWITKRQVKRNAAKEIQSGVLHAAPEATAKPPAFPNSELFYTGVERYALGMTSLPSANLARVAKLTEEKALFAPCMVGQLEGQFLKTITMMKGARRVLDVGTFTGYSAAAFAEAVPAGGMVVTIENDEETARAAAEIFSGFDEATQAKIDLRVTSALDEMKKLREAGEKFDIVFIDADKDNYIAYYDEAMAGLLSEQGVIMADNSLCALVYEEGDSRRDALHKFNQHVREDDRVEQSVLTVREGITIIMPKKN